MESPSTVPKPTPATTSSSPYEASPSSKLGVELEVDRLLGLEVDQLRVELTNLLKEVESLRSQVDKKKEYNELSFVIDNDPHQSGDRSPSSSGRESPIRFRSSFTTTMSGEASASSDSLSSSSASRLNSCFNCSQKDHTLSQCQETRDPTRIAVNKRKFASERSFSNGFTGGYSSRYHVGDLDSKFEPNAIPSKRLRDALGLKSGQLPQFVYRMRILGYPPAWMIEAQTTKSEFNLYLGNADDKEQLQQNKGNEGETDDKMEDGECEKELDDGVEFDVDKFIEWPGFNAPMPTDYVDESPRYHCPGFDPDQTLSKMIIELGPKAKKGVSTKPVVMETRVGKEEKQSSRNHLTDESKKTTSEGATMVEEEDTTVTTTEERITVAEECSSPKASQPSLLEKSTPIVGYYSPFSELPSVHKWAEGSSEIVNFENLPDSTGHWDRMRSLLAKQHSGEQRMEQERLDEDNQDAELEYGGVKVELDFSDL